MKPTDRYPDYLNTTMCWGLVKYHELENQHKEHNTRLGVTYKHIPLPATDPLATKRPT